LAEPAMCSVSRSITVPQGDDLLHRPLPFTHSNGGLDLAAPDRALPANANWRSIPGLRANVVCALGYTKLPFATTAASGRDGWIRSFADTRATGQVAPKADMSLGRPRCPLSTLRGF
jgi:hypothetical protein